MFQLKIYLLILIYFLSIIGISTIDTTIDVFSTSSTSAPLLTTLEEEWFIWKSDNNMTYDNTTDELSRRNNWEENKKLVEEHNKLYEQGLVSYKLELNEYGDMKNEEISESLLNPVEPPSPTRYEPQPETNSGGRCKNNQATGDPFDYFEENPPDRGSSSLPKSVDWREKGFISEPKQQSYCQSCWSFSSVAVLEAMYANKTGKLVTFSEQQLVDCSRDFGTFGCRGGWMTRALNYVINKGIMKEADYPYDGWEGNCKYNASAVFGKATKIIQIKPNEDALTREIVNIPTIAVAVNADSFGFKFYKSGVFYDKNCDKKVNHAVAIVGYGTDPVEGDFYIVKNSWGPMWGDNGYIKMARNRNNHCGIASYPMYVKID